MSSSSLTSDLRPLTSPRDSEVLVRVEGVSKIFCRDLKKSLWYGLQDSAKDLFSWGRRIEYGRSKMEHAIQSPISDLPSSSRLREGEFLAVDNISFELKRGECLGLIGRNGAGKTTLLKMLNGLIKPDAGRIEMRGRIGALIALGSGFNPILSGRENIYINGSILGLTKKEIDEKMDEIIDFAEIREFIDSPVQTYSSGMSVRLGFAVASSLCPDILILDEVLAVGDIGFVIKCLNRVRSLANNSAVIFVSHTMQFVSSFCTRVMVMDHGQCLLDATNPADGIDQYFSLIRLEVTESGSAEADIHSIRLKTGDGAFDSRHTRLPQGIAASLMLDLEIRGRSSGASVAVYIMDEAQTPVICIPVEQSDGRPHILPPGLSALEIPLGRLELCAGKYSFTVGIADVKNATVLNRTQGLLPFRIFAAQTHWGKIVRPAIAI